ncbi:PREDICTED: cystatin-9-like [Propithecus coquereli]|uniref:Cystatin 9 like n=1 Tax=Propithecus coquereli TaxID=379532 RepID=A0A2K6ELM0_PROCO|nr:PREDICTED: cystatin-9-like [Propithecus coquereli]
MSLRRAGALPWVLLLLLPNLKLLRTQAWCSEKEKDNNQKSRAPEFPATVEFALHTFNQQSQDDYAYRLVSILSSWREYSRYKQDDPKMVFSMKLQLRRTWCGKFEEDVDNCPFQESPKLNSTLICLFTVSTRPWMSLFELLNQTCSEELP